MIDTPENEYDLPVEVLIKRFAAALAERDPEMYKLPLDAGRHRVRLDNYEVRQTRRLEHSTFVVLKLTILSSRTLIPDGKTYVLFHDAHVRDRTSACRFFETLLGESTEEAIRNELTTPRNLGAELWVHVKTQTLAGRNGGAVDLLTLNWARVNPNVRRLEA